jgi:hypothetical protein
MNTRNVCELRERVWGIMYHIYVVRREKVTSSLQITFMGRGGEVVEEGKYHASLSSGIDGVDITMAAGIA